MEKLFWIDLQLFADGEGSGDGSGSAGESAPGVDAAAAGQQRLLELGVPADKIRRKASVKVGERIAAAEAKKPTKTKEPEEHNPDEGEEKPPVKKSFKELMEDPDYNREMQATIQARLRTAKKAEEDMGKLAPAIELLARKYGLDAAHMDYDALTKAINDDNDYYEDKALEMGVSVETAKKIDQTERQTAREAAEKQRTLEQQRIEEHFRKLTQQGEDLKKTFGSFDLMKELQNPVFARMTSPGVGLSVEDAYYAIHRKEIQAAAMQVTAKKTAEKLAASIQSGQRRPAENGTSAQAPSVTTFDYSKASKEQRREFKRKLMERIARGEKVYPGDI